MIFNNRNKVFYIVYETKCILNNKIYIGVHKTLDIYTDTYYGSGKYLLSAMKKYGKENFVRRILYIYHSELVAYKREAYIVNKIFLERKDTYNIVEGGKGGFKGYNTLKAKNKRVTTNILLYGNPAGYINTLEGKSILINKYGSSCGSMHTVECRSKMSNTKISNSLTLYPEMLKLGKVVDRLNNTLYEGTIYELSVLIHGKCKAIAKRNRILNWVESSLIIKQGKWKGLSVQYK